MDNKNIIRTNSSLEELAMDSLLVELLNKKQAEVFENIVFEGTRRYYIEDLTQRDYLLENTTPYQLEIEGCVFNEHAWLNLLTKFATKMIELFPEKLDNIYDFKCEWSKQIIFLSTERTNTRQIAPDLYINIGHTALHSCWLLQDLMDYFGVNKAEAIFLIHRPSGAEPAKVKNYIECRFKRNFAQFIISQYGKSKEYAETKVIKVIEKYINPMLAKASKSYVNFFLFDDYATLYNYVKKVREMIKTNIKYDENAKTVMNKYLDYLVEFYKN